MSYASLETLKGRLGVLSDAFDNATIPGDTDLLQYIADTAAEIDALVGGEGFSVPVTDPVAAAALAGWNADKAVLIALGARWPGGSGPAAVTDLRAAVERRLTAYEKAFDTGSLAALTYLRSRENDDAAGAANFWTREQDYSPWLDDIESGAVNFQGAGLRLRSATGPEFHKATTRF